MIDERTLLERAAERVPGPDELMERLIQRRDRRARSRRRAAIVLGIVVALGLVVPVGRILTERDVTARGPGRFPGRIAFVQEPGARGGLSFGDPWGSTATRIGESSAWPLAFSPDGSRLLVFHNEPGGVRDLGVLEADGSETRLGVSSPLQGASWSPDGARIVFSDGLSIAVMDADGSNVRTLLVADESSRYVSPAWAPDGSNIAYIRVDENSQRFVGELSLMDPDGGHPRPLVDPATGFFAEFFWGDLAFGWSPDARSIVFAARCMTSRCIRDFPHLDANPYLMTVRVDTGEIKVLQRALTHNHSNPRWLPDGRRISFYAETGGEHGIFVSEPGGSGLRPLLVAGEQVQYVEWKPASPTDPTAPPAEG